MISLTHIAPEDPLSVGLVGGQCGVRGGHDDVVRREYNLTLDAEHICIYWSML